ncbi:MAG: molecular chaperone HtpG [Alphaproteobacteria bacterium]|nr:molecular chaperone HtpG [Alphaproteobacteria bacterium]
MTAAAETLSFQAEVGKLLDIVAHALYSNKEIFLRELVSNASDACDKLRLQGLTDPRLLEGGAEFRISLRPDKASRQLTISDNGIGMNREDLVANLGTIAKSGTAEFLSRLSGDAKKDAGLIGQFGVGFYSSYMVASKVVVESRKAGETEGWRWTSDGQGSFVIEPVEIAARGTSITLHLRDGQDEFLEPVRLRHIVKTYSDHIAVPVVLIEEGKEETVNSASALWTRAKSEISDEQYKEFYHHVGHAFDEPWMTIHYRAEGALEYTGLLFVPTMRPFDLFNQERKSRVKLYVKRVFISDDGHELLPSWLRFLKGVVDSSDLPLNISREMLQHNPVLAKMRSGLVKRVLSDLKKRAEEEPEQYLAFWSNFGAVLKEGLYEEPERKEEMLDLVRFAVTGEEGPISLARYVETMKEGQDAIYTLTGDSIEALKRSPQIEGFTAKGVKVLLLTDPIDEFWVRSVHDYQGKPFKSVAEAGADLSKLAAKEGEEPAKEEDSGAKGQLEALIALMKKVLEASVKDVRRSDRLTESAVCLVAGEGDMSLHLERMLRAHKQMEATPSRILEVNPTHPLILKLAAGAEGEDAQERLGGRIRLLLDQARIQEGDPLPDPHDFAKRLAAVMIES